MYLHVHKIHVRFSQCECSYASHVQCRTTMAMCELGPWFVHHWNA